MKEICIDYKITKRSILRPYWARGGEKRKKGPKRTGKPATKKTDSVSVKKSYNVISNSFLYIQLL